MLHESALQQQPLFVDESPLQHESPLVEHESPPLQQQQEERVQHDSVLLSGLVCVVF
jgi:hypothetical protein